MKKGPYLGHFCSFLWHGDKSQGSVFPPKISRGSYLQNTFKCFQIQSF